jgi:hypothetical protein
MSHRVTVQVQLGDALKIRADVLALKYAQDLYGVDAQVVEELVRTGRRPTFPKPWDFCLVEAGQGIAATHVLFVGVPVLWDFEYREIRTFARKAMQALAGQAPRTRHVAFTIHGPGYGLDEVEAFEAEVAGLVDAVRSDEVPEALETITIIERNAARAQRLTVLMKDLVPEGVIDSNRRDMSPRGEDVRERIRAAGYASEGKAHVFVAMPFKDEMDDTYHYGIQGAVRTAGFLCERADLSAFTGDVLEWVRNRIRTASLVVADLTEANPNVYLEVGYAWGCGIPTVLLVRDATQLRFDVRGQRCLVYKNIKHLEEALIQELQSLRDKGNV